MAAPVVVAGCPSSDRHRRPQRRRGLAAVALALATAHTMRLGEQLRRPEAAGTVPGTEQRWCVCHPATRVPHRTTSGISRSILTACRPPAVCSVDSARTHIHPTRHPNRPRAAPPGPPLALAAATSGPYSGRGTTFSRETTTGTRTRSSGGSRACLAAYGRRAHGRRARRTLRQLSRVRACPTLPPGAPLPTRHPHAHVREGGTGGSGGTWTPGHALASGELGSRQHRDTGAAPFCVTEC